MLTHWSFKHLIRCECECCQKQDSACFCVQFEASAAIHANEMENGQRANLPDLLTVLKA